ncbi:hypothetical protein [Amycolatopsis jiangsuensis]|uniref:Cytochrome c oxidase assembly factor CtaG n=1 Tax=Amycolatopsis jiangsuensis TaxID=1181879 RepID=A0A840IYV6_9PSEU|nr:hypothetical protein [Amycolatopsis jiangsuensis]MBB4686595.1 cytochrome c oxidase assembly factor CtaG [Amycolatopsis jiangsuensis]
MIDLPQPTGAQLWPPEEAKPSSRLNQPWRAFVALGEVLVAAVALWLAFLLWHAGVITVVTTAGDGAQLASQRYFGGHLAGALGLGALAAVLVVDAIRQLLLAVRARRRKHKD